MREGPFRIATMLQIMANAMQSKNIHAATVHEFEHVTHADFIPGETEANAPYPARMQAAALADFIPIHPAREWLAGKLDAIPLFSLALPALLITEPLSDFLV